jgi:RNA polymerase sigma factor (TIGR02999 family)
MPPANNDLTLLLNRIGSDNISAEELLPLVYEELRHVAAVKMRGQSPGHTLQATALVHEAWLRVGEEAHGWQSRAHFFSAAAEAMRRILIDRARSKQAKRHGGGLERVDLEGVEIAAPAGEMEMLDVHETLDEFARHHPDKAELVKLRYFAGLSIEEAAEVLGISTPTVKRHWAFAKMWLFTEISRRRKSQEE